MTDAARSTPASLVGKLPITATTTDGVLTLAAGRLTFVTGTQTLVDHPVAELHSVARAANVGFEVWHGDRRYTLVPGHEVVQGGSPGGGALDAVVSLGQARRASAANARMRAERDRWIAVLQPLVGAPPPGVDVRPPRAAWLPMAAVAGIAIALMAIVTAIAVLAA